MANGDRALETRREWNATWWLPHIPEVTASGTLTYEPDSYPRLELDGNLGFDRETDWPDVVPTILGRDTSGKEFSLLRSWWTQRKNLSGAGVVGLKLSSALAIVGKHVPALGPEEIRAVRVQYSLLESWTGYSELMHPDWQKRPSGLWRVTIGLDEPPRYSFEIDDVGKLSVEPIIGSGPAEESPALFCRAQLCLETDGRPWFQWYVPKLERLERLLSLLIQQPVLVREVSAVMGEGDEPAGMYFRRAQGRFPESLQTYEVGFPLDTIRDQFADVLSRWFNSQDVFEIPVDLYWQSRQHTGSSLSVPLLDIMRAVEVFHRRTRGGVYHDDEEYTDTLLPELRAFVSALPSTFSSDFRTKLKNQLKYANEYSLRKRMDLIRRSTPVLPGIHAEESFWHRIVKTRNFLTHFDEADKAEAHKPHEYWKAIIFLQRLLSYLMLTELGLPEDKVLEGLGRAYGTSLRY